MIFASPIPALTHCVGCGGPRMLHTTWSSGKVEAEGVCWLREGRGDFKMCSRQVQAMGNVYHEGLLDLRQATPTF